MFGYIKYPIFDLENNTVRDFSKYKVQFGCKIVVETIMELR